MYITILFSGTFPEEWVHTLDLDALTNYPDHVFD